jgi:hypothetical protein
LIDTFSRLQVQTQLVAIPTNHSNQGISLSTLSLSGLSKADQERLFTMVNRRLWWLPETVVLWWLPGTVLLWWLSGSAVYVVVVRDCCLCGGCQWWLSVVVVSSGCQWWLSRTVFVWLLSGTAVFVVVVSGGCQGLVLM